MFMVRVFVRRIVLPALAAAVLAGIAQPAYAQLSRVGGPISIPLPVAAQMRIPDTAFDRQDNAYLVVTGGTPIKGQFLSQDGVPYDQLGFAVTSTDCGTVPPCDWQWSMMPRVAYGEAGISLVVWLDTRRVVPGVPNGSTADIYGRLVQYGVGPIGPDFLIGLCEFGAQSESPAAVAYSTADHEFLVAWTQLRKGVRVRRVSISGGMLSGEIIVTGDPTTGLDPDGPMQASVGYDAAANNFLVAWAAYNYTANFAYIAGVRVQSGSGVTLGGPFVLKTGVYATIPQVAYNSTLGQYFVFWYERGGALGPIYYARAIGGDGSLPGDIVPVTTYAAYDALGVDYNASTRTYLISTLSDTPEDLAIEVSASGTASPPIVATANGGTGNFNPRVAAHATRPQWLLVTSKSFLRVVGQLLQSATNVGNPPGPTGFAFGAANAIQAQPGGTLTINGSGFGATQGSIVIQLGGVALTVQLWSDTQIVLLIPANAQTAQLSAIVNGVTINGPMLIVTGGAAPSADFNGDGQSDIVWRHATRGNVWVWLMNSVIMLSQTNVGTVADLGWQIRGLGDFNGDGKTDLLWRHQTDGSVFLWEMNGAAVTAGINVGWAEPEYSIAGVGDFDGDGKADILWRNPTTGDLWIWLMDGATVRSKNFIDRVDPAYQVAGVGDFDGDGKSDIVWWHSTRGEVWIWLMAGTTVRSRSFIASVPDTRYHIVGVGDYNGDGRADLLWNHATRGEIWLWPMAGTTLLGENYVATVPDVGYRIASTGDFDGDGKADILWHHVTNGQVWVWLMDGSGLRTEIEVAVVPDLGYQVAGGR